MTEYRCRVCDKEVRGWEKGHIAETNGKGELQLWCSAQCWAVESIEPVLEEWKQRRKG